MSRTERRSREGDRTRKLSERGPNCTDLQIATTQDLLSLNKVRKFLREAEENGETGDLNSKGAGPADDKCFLCLKVKPDKSEFHAM